MPLLMLFPMFEYSEVMHPKGEGKEHKSDTQEIMLADK